MDIKTALEALPNMGELPNYVAPSAQTLYEVDPTAGGGFALTMILAIGALAAVAAGAVSAVGRGGCRP